MPDDDYDDTPYRDSIGLSPSHTVSYDFETLDQVEYVWVYVDGEDTRLARQRFVDGDPEYLVWIAGVFSGIRSDPEGRDQCGDCGNYRPREHAPDCRYAYLNV